jgi:murein DD-endopeptidase MepM/ murein hydrolase activator NlpD
MDRPPLPSLPSLLHGLRAAVLSGLLILLPEAALAQARRITVVEGDTLEQLALRHGVSLEALIRLNGISEPQLLQVGQVLLLPGGRPAAADLPLPPADSQEPAAALLLSPAERRDRAELALREQSGLVRWKWFNATAVDWAGWKLHPGGVRITLVKPAAADLGLRGAGATAVAVQCESLRQTWRIDGSWEPWQAAMPGSVAQRIVLDLCSNTLDGPAVPVPPPPVP